MVNKYSEIYKRIGGNLKRERRKSKLTQEELAAKTAKVDASKISNIENAREDFMFSTLLELTNGLNIDVDELLKRKTP